MYYNANKDSDIKYAIKYFTKYLVGIFASRNAIT